MTFELDFVRDVSAIFRTHLAGLGYRLTPGLSDEEVRIAYINAKHRLVATRPRGIHRATGFACPPTMAAGLAHLEARIAGGDDLRPHLSRGIVNATYSDSLLNDWGISHFHLGTTLDADGFAARTGPLLFARMTSTDAYLIGVRAHGGWSSQDLLATIFQNWPETIERYRLRGVSGLAYGQGGGPLNDTQIAEMRQAGICVMHELAPGMVYAPIGGGYTTNGKALPVVRENFALVKQLRGLETDVKQFETQLRTELSREGTTLPEPVGVFLERRHSGDMVAVVGASVAEMTVGELSLF